MAAVVALKKDLRKKIKAILKDVSDASAETQSAHAAKALFATPEYKAAKRISVYLSMPAGEIMTTSIVHDAIAQGKQVFVPHTYGRKCHDGPKSIMDMLQLASLSDFEACEPDKWGIPTFSEDTISTRENCFGTTGTTRGNNDNITDGLDLIVMPGMAFDSEFGRLGHGKGYYDFFLQRCHQASRMPRQSWSGSDRAAASARRIYPHGPVRLSPRRPDHRRWRGPSRWISSHFPPNMFSAST